MRANLRLIRKSRIYSDEFKREVVSLFEGGKYSVLQLERLYGISNPAIYQWIYRFSTFNVSKRRIIEIKLSITDTFNGPVGSYHGKEQIVESSN